MRNNKHRLIVCSVLSVFCGAAVSAGVFAGTQGLRLHADAEDTLLYGADFENLTTAATADEIYGATSIAGPNRSIVQSKSPYIEAPYTFAADGNAALHLYLDCAGLKEMEETKTYSFSLEFEAYGDYIAETYLILGGSYLKFFPDGTSAVDNVAPSVVVMDAVRTDNVWTAELTFTGKSGSVPFEWFMKVEPEKYEEANREGTGFRISRCRIKEGETERYTLSPTPGPTGGNAVFGATGFAGGNDSTTIKAGSGITGKTLKAVYDFWPTADGGWQKEGVYNNENNTDIRMETGKRYGVEFSVSPFGKVDQAVCVFEQVGVADITSQAILKGDGTYDVVDSGAVKSFESCSIVKEGNVFKIKAVVKGLGGKFKLSVNMHSSDADGANAAKDTGIYFDDCKIREEKGEEPAEPDVSGEYKTLYSVDFNKVPLDTSGSDAMYHATGFGTSGGMLGVCDGGISSDRCMKAVYEFYTDGGWQKGNAYLDSGKTGSTSADGIYCYKMKIKPFGGWTNMSIGFAYPSDVREYVYLQKDGTISLEKNADGKLIKAEVNYAGGVYDLSIYLYGTDGWISNFFNMQAADAAASNANKDTGFYLDDYLMSKQKKAETVGINKKSSFYNKALGGDFLTTANFTDIASVKINEIALTGGQYTFVNELLTVKENVLKALANGTYTLTVESGEGNRATAEIVVGDAASSTVKETDFSGMPDLNGDQTAKDVFYQNGFMDPAFHNIFTVDEGENRIIKFINPGDVSEEMKDLFQTNPREGRLNMLGKDKWHTVSMDWRPQNGATIGIRGQVYEGDKDTQIFYMEIDLANGKRVDDGAQSYNASWSVTKKTGGWYTLTISFFYTGDAFGENAAAYCIFKTAKENENTVWYLDNIDVKSELYPSLVSGSANYDVASGNTPYYLIDLCRVFDIASIKIGNTLLTATSDYTVSVTPLGYTRIDLTEAFCKKYEIGSENKISVLTTKGNTVNLDFNVVDTAPELPSEAIAVDKAEQKDLEFNVDLAGYEIAKISLRGEDLVGTEFILNAQGTLVFKYSYLKTLAVNSHEFTVITTSGASGRFTIIVTDSTPVFSEAPIYEKSGGGDYSIGLIVNGKEIVSVKLGDKTLTAAEFTYSDNTLIVKSSVMKALVAGDYELTVTTLASVSATITVKDAPPLLSGEYSVKQGSDLVVTAELYGKKIISVTVDGLKLREGEYSYADGKLTIAGSVFEEISVGERKLTLVTEGGAAEIIFTLQEKAKTSSEDGIKVGCSGCGSSATGSVSLIGVGAAAVVLIRKKRR